MRGLQIMSLLAAWTTFAVVLQVAGNGSAAPDSAKRASPPPIKVGLAPEQPKDKPPVARAEPVPASAKGAGRASEGPAIRIDATFDDPAGTVRWMLGAAGGWMAVAVDRNHQPIGRVLQDGKVVPPGVVTSGIPRQATAEVASIMPQGLPQGAVAAWLIWPSRYWQQVERGLRAYGDVRSAKVRYAPTQQGLAVTVVEVQTAQGVIQPNAVFNIRS